MLAPSYDLSVLGRYCHTAHMEAEPFPHSVFDGFIDKELASEAYREVPMNDDPRWKSKVAVNSKKKYLSLRQVGPATKQLIGFFNSPEFVSFLSELTGIPDLQVDPDQVGEGIAEGLTICEPGGFLNVHADFNWHPGLRMYRRANLLYYLNPKWKESYGGHLELWDRGMTKAVQVIPPLFNRCVIFNTDDYSYHGHPHPLTCLPSESRKTITTYYYAAAAAPGSSTEAHTTLYQRLPRV